MFTCLANNDDSGLTLVAAKKSTNCKHGRFRHVQLNRTEDMDNQHSFNVGTQAHCHQFSARPNVKYDHNLPFCSWVMFFAEHYDIALKWQRPICAWFLESWPFSYFPLPPHLTRRNCAGICTNIIVQLNSYIILQVQQQRLNALYYGSIFILSFHYGFQCGSMQFGNETAFSYTKNGTKLQKLEICTWANISTIWSLMIIGLKKIIKKINSN